MQREEQLEQALKYLAVIYENTYLRMVVREALAGKFDRELFNLKGATEDIYELNKTGGQE